MTSEEHLRAHRIYWYYRTRFINDFTHIGKEQGDCITFAERNYDYTDQSPHLYNKFYSKVGPDQIDFMNQYLSALALEYKLLSRNNQSTAETVKEIFYLLKTINRLDKEAEQFWGNNPPDDEQELKHLQLNGSTEEPVDMCREAKGIYLLKITSSLGFSSVKKVSVN